MWEKKKLISALASIDKYVSDDWESYFFNWMIKYKKNGVSFLKRIKICLKILYHADQYNCRRKGTNTIRLLKLMRTFFIVYHLQLWKSNQSCWTAATAHLCFCKYTKLIHFVNIFSTTLCTLYFVYNVHFILQVNNC